ncbi:MAG: LytR/AlgR family response regulator transcription factor [Myxococcales bacterium]|nr:LytTR family DNA-binding domain-containing protein [Myxococcales bacterium]
MSLRALVVDDEPLARSGIAELVASTPGFEVAGEAADGDAAIAAVRELRPDLVLLDVQMPGRDGFDVIRAVGPARMPPVIFVTAHDAFALKAFEVHAVDYVMKPFRDRRLREALERARRPSADLARRLEALMSRLDEPRFEVRLGNRVLVVSSSEIDWVEGAGYYAVLHAGEATHLLRETLNEIEARLDRSRFLRVHRSAIVRLDRIRELRPRDRVVVMQTGTRVRVSRSRWPAVRSAVSG